MTEKNRTGRPVRVRADSSGWCAPDARFVAQARDITQHKQADEQLRLHSQLLSNLAEGVLMVRSADSVIQYANPRFEKLFGYAPGELLGQPVSVLHASAERDPSQVAQEISRALTNSGVWAGDVLNVRKDGTKFWSHANISTLDHPLYGKIWLTVQEDIAERKRTEQALRESEERYRLMVETIPLLTWRTDAAGQTTDCNERWYEYTGQTPEEARGSGWMRVVHPDDVQRTLQQVRDDVARGDFYQAEYRLRRGMDGHYRWHLARGLPVRDQEGKILCWFGCAADIDDQKRAEEELRQLTTNLESRVRERTDELGRVNEALRESEDRFRNAFMNAMNGVALIAPTGRFVQVNRAFCEMGGYSAPELQGLNFQSLIHPADLFKMLGLLEQMLTGVVATAEIETRYFDKQSRVKWAHVNASLVRDVANQPVYFVAHAQDVTEQKQLEQAIGDAREREQQRLAEDLHDSLGQRLTGVAFLCKALQLKLSKRSKAAAAEAEAITRLVTTAIAHTKDLARSLYPVELESNGLCAALQELAVTTGELFRIHCSFHCADRLKVQDHAVAKQLYRIAQEAISNAVQHGDPKSAEISLTRRAEAIVLKIQDDGCGFLPDNRTTNGIGLQIMKHRAKSIGASLEIDAQPGRGTTVRCRWNPAI